MNGERRLQAESPPPRHTHKRHHTLIKTSADGAEHCGLAVAGSSRLTKMFSLGSGVTVRQLLFTRQLTPPVNITRYIAS